MAKQLPEWLDKSFLEAAIQREEKESEVKVKEFSAVVAVAAGNNYTSQIFRVQVTYTTDEDDEKSIALIVKAPHLQFQNMEDLGIGGIFEKEPRMYFSVLPKAKDKIKHQFGPTNYYSTQKNVLVLQDLKPTGYVMCDKFAQLDYDHCELVFKTLAKFHAVSAVFHQDCPTEIEDLGSEPIFREGNPLLEIMKPLMSLNVGIVVDALRQTDDSEATVQFLLGKQENLFGSLVEIFKPKEDGLNVLNHGDLWINNMLFKHSDSGEVEDVKFIDYQMLRYMSPAIDILYFTWTSADEDVREKRLPELYDVYIKTLNHFLRQLGCEQTYTTEELWQDMRAAVDFALSVTCQTLPMMLASEEDAFDMSEFDMEEFVKMSKTGEIDPNILRLYNGKQFKAKVPTIMKQIFKTLQ